MASRVASVGLAWALISGCDAEAGSLAVPGGGAGSAALAPAAGSTGPSTSGTSTSGTSTAGASSSSNAEAAQGATPLRPPTDVQAVGSAPALGGTALRPQLSSDAAAKATVLAYLAAAGSITAGLTSDGWDPTAGVGDESGFTATFRVAPDSPYTTVQSAITAAVESGSSARQYISVAPGTYRELVCVPAEAPPITLYGTNPDAAQTAIVFGNYSGKPKAPGTPANPCNPNLSGETIGTSGSTTFAVYAAEFHAKNLSFVNDTDESKATSESVQGVALTAQGDRLIFENVRVLGNQDTLFLKTPNVDTVARSYFESCYVEGDTDFIFGRGTAVLDGCTIHSITSRTPSGVILAPSTDSRNELGFLINRGTFSGDAGAGAGSTHLGRAWDESQSNLATYAANVDSGVYPNGQATVRGSTLGPHIQSEAPWRAAATTARPYSSVRGTYPANRFYEFENTGPGSAASSSAPTAP